ncbi:Anaphase-promoting complex, cyclosome, subunit 3 [Parapedobacter luteus]|uniref:Anaphase-promoting complex, cyclosome, subunit 3 n=1 Tax=Parapedobacter luteus TaxID=623280 RepID=A0A1T5B3V1_9SPHI|nr:Anaphase-promoting complex, cyclosome, subunit 3 [Parapedobacter luteus]
MCISVFYYRQVVVVIRNILYLLSLIYFLVGCQNPTDHSVALNIDLHKQQGIIKKYLLDSARQYSYYSKEWQKYIDMGLQEDSTIAYLWQQKAMPLFKQGKYELGMQYLDKAVYYDRSSWLSYRAFIKCIFAKTYRAAIADFEECMSYDGNSHVMDHSYRFYIALSLLQLNEFQNAEALFKEEIDQMQKERGEEWVHHLELFYYGISLYEQRKYESAVEAFDRALNNYHRFSDVKYYKAISLAHLGKTEEASAILEEAKFDRSDGYTITEDNVIYERYPYQVRWDQHGLHQ